MKAFYGMEEKRNIRERKENEGKERGRSESERGLMDVTSQHRGRLSSWPPPLGKAKNKTIVNNMAEMKVTLWTGS